MLFDELYKVFPLNLVTVLGLRLSGTPNQTCFIQYQVSEMFLAVRTTNFKLNTGILDFHINIESLHIYFHGSSPAK